MQQGDHLQSKLNLNLSPTQKALRYPDRFKQREQNDNPAEQPLR